MTASGSSKKITGLSADTIYLVQIAATNAVGDSDWSERRSAGTAGVPGVPTQLSLPISGTSLLARWTAPADNGGSAITGYKLRHCVAGTGASGCASGWTLITTSGTGTNHTISGLAANTTYRVQVAATNNIGDSDWSPSSSATTGNAS